MKTVKVKKLWMGHLVSIRDYSVNKGIEEGGLTVEHDNKLLVFGGRILRVQAPAFLADDGTRARNLLQGIFELEWGPEFRTVSCAWVNKINQIYEIRKEGKLQLPKIES